jgi:hypothetical protein
MNAATTTTANDYPAIRAWGKQSGSMKYYIDAQVEKARAAKAPQNATYERDGHWFTTDDIVDLHTRADMQTIAEIHEQLKAGR